MSLWSWLGGAPKKSARMLEVERTLGMDKVQAVQQQVAHVVGKVGKSSTQLKGVTLTDELFLQQLCGLPPEESLSQSLAAAVRAAAEHDAVICLESILIFKVRLEGSGEESREACFSLLQGGKGDANKPVDRTQLQKAVASAIRIALQSDAPSQVVDAIVAGALQQGGADSAEAITLHGYTKWCKAFPAVHQVLRNLMHRVGKLGPPKEPALFSVLPELVIPQHRGPSKLLLQNEWVWALKSALPEDCRQTWRLLFNSQRDGQSFSTFVSRLGDLAPTLLLIQDKEGHLFGGFATQAWQKKGSFYGDSGCFIFGLLPKLVVHPSTGINENYQWCGMNFSQLPNGIGLGGQVGHYGVYVDDTLDTGISRPIATFANESLASKQNFEVETVECWLLKPPEEEEDGTTLQAGNTVLDRNKEARNFMELAGVKVNHSEGVNSEPPPELML